MTRQTLVYLTLAAAVPFFPAGAQRPQGRVVLGGGSGTDIRGVRSAAYSFAPSLFLFPSGAALVALGARATTFSTGAWALGGSATFRARQGLAGPLALSWSGSGEYTSTSYDVTYGIVDAAPTAELRLGALTVFGGVHAAAARTTTAVAAPAPPPPPLLPPSEPAVVPLGQETFNRTSLGPVFGGSVRAADLGWGQGVTLEYREDRAHVASVPVTDRRGSVQISAGPVTAGASYGRRDAPDEKTGFGGASLAVALTPVMAAFGAIERYPSNRLTGTLAGRTVSAGVALTFGGPGRARPLPSPRGVAPPQPGMTRLAIKAPDALRVEIAGDWNHWKAEPVRRSADVWYVDLALPPGEYRYAFRIDGIEWRVPEGAAAVDDGFGGKSAWITVRRTTRSNTQPKEDT